LISRLEKQIGESGSLNEQLGFGESFSVNDYLEFGVTNGTRFEHIKDGNGDVYIGETLDDERHGRGIDVLNDGDICFGYSNKDNYGVGKSIHITKEGEVIVGEVQEVGPNEFEFLISLP